MGVKPHGDLDLGDDLGMLGISDVEDRSAMGRIHVSHVAVAVFDFGLPAARQIDFSDLLDLVAYPNLHLRPLAVGAANFALNSERTPRAHFIVLPFRTLPDGSVQSQGSAAGANP